MFEQPNEWYSWLAVQKAKQESIFNQQAQNCRSRPMLRGFRGLTKLIKGWNFNEYIQSAYLDCRAKNPTKYARLIQCSFEVDNYEIFSIWLVLYCIDYYRRWSGLEHKWAVLHVDIDHWHCFDLTENCFRPISKLTQILSFGNVKAVWTKNINRTERELEHTLQKY